MYNVEADGDVLSKQRTSRIAQIYTHDAVRTRAAWRLSGNW